MSLSPSSLDSKVSMPEFGSRIAIELHDGACWQRNQVMRPTTFSISETDGTIAMECHREGKLAVFGKAGYRLISFLIHHAEALALVRSREGERFGLREGPQPLARHRMKIDNRRRPSGLSLGGGFFAAQPGDNVALQKAHRPAGEFDGTQSTSGHFLFYKPL